MSTPLPSARRSSLAALALLSTAALTLSACGSNESSPAPEPQTSSGTAAPLALAQGLTGDEGATTNSPSDRARDEVPKIQSVDQTVPPRLTLTRIRVGEHGGMDRVVFEFGGTGTPGYDVTYVDRATQQGSGRPVDVPGRSFLQASATGQALPLETGLTEVPRGTVGAPEGSGVAGVAFGGQFEGTAQAVIGLTGERKPFSVFTLNNPTRLVVDVLR